MILQIRTALILFVAFIPVAQLYTTNPTQRPLANVSVEDALANIWTSLTPLLSTENTVDALNHAEYEIANWMRNAGLIPPVQVVQPQQGADHRTYHNTENSDESSIHGDLGSDSTKCMSQMTSCDHFSPVCCVFNECCVRCNASESSDVPDTLRNISAYVNSSTTARVCGIAIIVQTEEPDIASLFQIPKIDVSYLGKLSHQERVNLTSFQIIRSNKTLFFQNYAITFDNGTFSKLSTIRELTLQISTNDATDLVSMITPLKHLEILQLISLRSVSPCVLNSTLITMRKEKVPLKKIVLKNFQIKGTYGPCHFLSIFRFNEMFGSWDPTITPFYNTTTLDLSYNGFDRIDAGISEVFPNLQNLDVSFNCLIAFDNVPFLFEVFWHPNLRVIQGSYQAFLRNPTPVDRPTRSQMGLRLENGNFVDYLRCVKQHVNNLELQNITGIACALVQCAPSILRVDPIPTCANVTHCLKQSVFNMLDDIHRANFRNGTFPKHKILSLFACEFLKCVYSRILRAFPCLEFPELTRFLIHNNTKCSVVIPFGQNIRYVAFDEMAFDLGTLYLPRFHHICLERNQLSYLSMADNEIGLTTLHFKNDIESSYFVGLDNLTFVNLHKNGLNEEVFQTMRYFANLRTVDLSSNYIKIIPNYSICKNSPHLKDINLTDNSITRLKGNFLSGCTSLKKVSFYDNRLQMLRDEPEIDLDLTGVHQLKVLNLSRCNLPYLPRKMMKALDPLLTGGNLTIDLKDNPFVCSCNPHSTDFIEWFKIHPHNFVNYEKAYCIMHYGNQPLHLVNIAVFKFKCNIIAYVVPTTVVFTSLVVYLFVCAWTKRWRLRYLCYQCKRKICCTAQRVSSDNSVHGRSHSAKFDAFVSYSAKDRFWVHDVLMKTLEDKYGFRLCIHYRDFPVGDNIIDTTLRFMSESRVIIVVMTQEFISRDWCMFELKEADRIGRMGLNTASLVIIKLGSINIDANTPPMVSHMLDTYTYLEWSKDSAAHKLFWSKLVHHLYGSHDECCGCCWYGSIKSDHVRALADSEPEDHQFQQSGSRQNLLS